MNNASTVFSPKIIVRPDAQAASLEAANVLASAIRQQPNIVLGLATGGTPVQMYAELIRQHGEGDLDFSRVTTFNLDEYIGLAADHPQSYRTFMQRRLFDSVNVEAGNTHLPDGLTTDPVQCAREYEARIAAAGGIDLQLLGIGENGHIAFNEPHSTADSRTRVVQLTDSTIANNARFFASRDEVPRTAITMGIGTILEAKRVVLLATGSHKAEAIRRTVHGPPSDDHPASLLQTHANVTLVLDEEAASGIA